MELLTKELVQELLAVFSATGLFKVVSVHKSFEVL
jgi:hypothetical protein